MDKRIILFILPLLVLTLSYAQFGIELIENNMFWFLAMIATVATVILVSNVLERFGRAEISRPAGLFAGVAMFSAFWYYRDSLSQIIGQYVLYLIVVISFLIVLMKLLSGKNKDLSGVFKNYPFCIIGLILMIIGTLLSFTGWSGSGVIFVLGVASLLFCAIFIIFKEWGSGGKDNPPGDGDIKVKVTVVTTKGYAISGAMVETGTHKATTDREGIATFKLVKGKHTFVAKMKGCDDRAVTKKINRFRKKVKIELKCDNSKETNQVTVKVTNQDGKNIPGAEVNFGQYPQQMTNHSGEAIFVDVLDGDYKLEVSRDKCKPKPYKSTEKITGSKVIPVTLECDPGDPPPPPPPPGNDCEILQKFYNGHQQMLGEVYKEVYGNVKDLIKGKQSALKHDFYSERLYDFKKTTKIPSNKLLATSLNDNIANYKVGKYPKGTTQELNQSVIAGQATFVFLKRVEERLKRGRVRTAKTYIGKINKKYPEHKIPTNDFLKVLIPYARGKKPSVEKANKILETQLKNHPCYDTLKKGLNEYFAHFQAYFKRMGPEVKKLL